MIDPALSPAIASKLKTLRILCLALILGVVMFGVIAAASAAQAPASAQTTPGANQVPVETLRWAAVGTLVACVLAALLMHRQFSRMASALGDVTDEQMLVSRHIISTIIVMALLEGPALFGAVLTFLSRDVNDLVFLAVPLLAMLAAFPTHGKWRTFIERTTSHHAIRR